MRKIFISSLMVCAIIVFSGCNKETPAAVPAEGASVTTAQNNTQVNNTPEQENAIKEETAVKKRVSDSEGAKSFVGSMKELLGRGKSVKCTYDQVVDGVKLNYIMYVGTQGDVRIESTIIDPEIGTINSAAIMSSQEMMMYSWVPDSNIGMKIDVKKMEEMTDKWQAENPDFKPDPNASIYAEENLDMKCTAWGVDPSKFVVPTNVQFQDWIELMNQLGM